MERCCVPQCNRYGDINSYSFPHDPELRIAWINAIKSGHKDCKHSDWAHSLASKVCSNHFQKEDFRTFQIDGVEIRTHQLKRTAVPSKHILCRRVAQRKILAVPPDDTGFNHLWHDSASINLLESADEFIFHTDDNLVSINVQLKSEVNKLTDEHAKLRKGLKMSFFDKQTVTNDESLCDLTGVLSDKSFKSLLNIVTPGLSPQLKKMPLSLETQLMLVLMKLKLGLPDKVLCPIYCLELEDLHELYSLWLNSLSCALIPLIKMPSSTMNMQQPTGVFFGDFVSVNSEASQTSRPSRTYRKISPSRTEDVGTLKKVLVLLPLSGLVVYVSEPVPFDTTAFSALRAIPNLDTLLVNLDKIFIISSQETVSKKDLELGVMLECDESSIDAQFTAKIKSPFVKASTILSNLKNFVSLNSGFDPPFNVFSSSIVKVCAVITSLENEILPQT